MLPPDLVARRVEPEGRVSLRLRMQRRLEFLNRIRSCQARASLDDPCLLPCVPLEFRPVPSAGVTRLPRHPAGPSWPRGLPSSCRKDLPTLAYRALAKAHELGSSQPQRVPCATIEKQGLSTVRRATNRLYVATLHYARGGLCVLPGVVTLFLDTAEPTRTER